MLKNAITDGFSTAYMFISGCTDWIGSNKKASSARCRTPCHVKNQMYPIRTRKLVDLEKPNVASSFMLAEIDIALECLEEVVERKTVRKGRWNGGYWGQLSAGGEEALGEEVRGASSRCER